jgi:hypothetical protein
MPSRLYRFWRHLSIQNNVLQLTTVVPKAADLRGVPDRRAGPGHGASTVSWKTWY